MAFVGLIKFSQAIDSGALPFEFDEGVCFAGDVKEGFQGVIGLVIGGGGVEGGGEHHQGGGAGGERGDFFAASGPEDVGEGAAVGVAGGVNPGGVDLVVF